MRNNRLWIVLSGGLFALACFALHAAASQVHLQRFEQAGGGVEAIWRVKVLAVSRHDTHMKLRDGSKGPLTRMRWDYQCVPIRSIAGATVPTGEDQAKPAKITMSFTQIVPVVYDEDGKKKMHFSYYSPMTGIEGSLKPNTEYLICMGSAKPIEARFHFMRAEQVDREQALVAEWHQAKAWRYLQTKHQAVLDSIEVAAFDAKLGLMVVFEQDGKRRVALVAPGKAELRLSDEIPRERIIQVYGDAKKQMVIIRMSIDRLWELPISRFKVG